MKLSIGTKSVLFGAHQFIIHPVILFLAWWKLYGFPTDLRLWVAFVIHDLGYIGKPNMDGPEGETHVEFGANVMARLFGPEWGDFCRYHSRFYAKRDGKHFSRLCVADKMAIVLDPWWLYLPRVWITGEINEYMRMARDRSASKYAGEMRSALNMRDWHNSLVTYLVAWIAEHKDGREDTWTLAEKPPELHVYANEATEWYVAKSAADAVTLMCELSGENPEDFIPDDEFEEWPDDKPLKIWFDQPDLPKALPDGATQEPKDGIIYVSATCAAWAKHNGRGFLCTDLV